LVSDAAANTVGGEPALADEVVAGLAADWVVLLEALLEELLLPHPAASARPAVARSITTARRSRCRLVNQSDMILAPY
jgi:hypothetical protein